MDNPTNTPSCCCSCCPQRCIRLCGSCCGENGRCGGGRCSRFCIPCSKFIKIPKFCQRKQKEKEKTRQKRSQSSEHEIHSTGTDVAAGGIKNDESCWKKLNCCKKGSKMDQKVNDFLCFNCD